MATHSNINYNSKVSLFYFINIGPYTLIIRKVLQG